jgi:two-component system, OmpR family, sensor kinase
MSRLYTRIFASFWAVLGLVVAGTAAVTWLVLAERSDSLPRAAAALVTEAGAVLRSEGEAGLKQWLALQEAGRPELHVFILDASGRELLGRHVPPFLAHHRHGAPGRPGELPVEPHGPGPAFDPLTMRLAPHWLAPSLITAADGRSYDVFVVGPRPRIGLLGIPESRWAVLLLAIVVTGSASWLLTRSITRPVSALGAATRDLAAGNLDVRVQPAVSARRDELGALSRDFDAMAARLRETLRGRERLLGDISHELRSPLARMRVALGIARQPGGDVGRQLARLDAETERLDRLIGQVLQLSRLDAGAGTLAVEDVDLAELVDGIARDAAFEAQARDVRIDWQAPAHGVRVRYAAPGSAVAIALEEGASALSIVVRDRGPGVPESELERIFEPFHRIADSRERDSGGDGIGLAITARVIKAHGGYARAANAPGGGLCVTLELPRPAGSA